MKKELRNGLIVLGCVAIFLSIAFYISKSKKEDRPKLPFYGKGEAIQPNEYDASMDNAIHRVSDFKFINQEGKVVTQKTFADCIYVSDYIFTTCPGICKEMSREMKKVYQKFINNSQVKILSHTSKPEEDSVSVLLSYAKSLGVTQHDKWMFVTGNIDSLYKMALKNYLIVDETESEIGNTFVHTERMALIDKNKHIRGFYDGTKPAETEKLIKDIEKLLSEK